MIWSSTRSWACCAQFLPLLTLVCAAAQSNSNLLHKVPANNYSAAVWQQQQEQQQLQQQQQPTPSPLPQYPAQQYPAPQYPAEQYPGQQYPAEQYPAQQYPPQQVSQRQEQPVQYPTVQQYVDNSWKFNGQPQQQQHLAQPLGAPPASPPAPTPTLDPWRTQVDRIISRGVLQLSLSLANAVEQDTDQSGLPSNVVFSPVNVACALALVLAGSNGTTFSEIAKVLGIAGGLDLLRDRVEVHKEFGRFLSQIENQAYLAPTDPGTQNTNASANQVLFANGLFVQQDYKIQPYFAEIARAYRSEVIPVEFYRDPGRTKEKINSWFAEHTSGRIKSVLAEAAPADTRLMIASALFFNGAWETPFPLEATMIRPFIAHAQNGSTELFAVRMMTNNLDLPFVADRVLGCRMLQLPYRGRDVSMFMILPDAHGLDKLRELERRLTPDIITDLIANMKDAPVIYSVPRMKLERSISLRTALETLGVRSMFDSNHADLSYVSDSGAERVDHTKVPSTPTGASSAPSHATPAPAATTPSPSTTTTANPRSPYVKRPSMGENTIAPNSPLYFVDRMALGGNANNSLPVDFAERWATPNTKLYADDVLHKVEVEVTETGTIASAATAITISRDGSNHVMRFNRPFVFFIRHNPTGFVLFYGSVVRPQVEWIVSGVDPNLLVLPSNMSGQRVPSQNSRRQYTQQQRQRQYPPPQQQG